VALAVISCYTSISGLVKAELFPGEVRALGVGLPYAVANALFGGTAEYVGLWFKSIGAESGFFWYVTGFFLLALVTAWMMPETRIESHLAREHGGALRR
jgi:MHS family alpha-ketoglutarate permease-like MFS transporter